MNKNVARFTAALLAATIVAAPASAKPKKKTHTHNYSTFVSYLKKPTCTVAGTAVYKCSCGKTKNKTVSALGHKWVNCNVGYTTGNNSNSGLSGFSSGGRLSYSRSYSYKKCSRCGKKK